MIRNAAGLAFLWVVLAGASPLPLTPPPPDLTRLVPFAVAPVDKPPVALSDPKLPAPAADLPTLPAASLALPVAERPMAPRPAPKTGACVLKVFGRAKEALECGESHFAKGEFDDAVRSLDQATRAEADVAREARYWLGESYLRLRRVEQADWAFRQAAGDAPRQEYELWAAHASGWTALQLGDLARARDTFKKLAGGIAPVQIDLWTRHGLALALYGLGDYAGARDVWADLNRRVPQELAREVAFWYGDTLGRLGDYAGAQAELGRFLQGGQHPLFEAGRLRFAWWSLIGGRAADAVAPFRAVAATSGRGADPEWAEAGLALALAQTGDWEGAKKSAASLRSKRSTLALPVSLQLVRRALDAEKAADAQAIVQDLLASQITQRVRAWLLLANGDALRAQGNRDEARTQYELARQTDPASEIGLLASLRIARVNFDMREFAQTVTDVQTLLRSKLPPDVRAEALALQGEAAYRAGDWSAAADAFRRALVEFPEHPEAPSLRLSLAWVALRQNQRDEARRLFLDFARAMPEHPQALDALELASELALASGNFDDARRELEQIITAYPTRDRTDFARLNRAILLVRTGQVAEAQGPLRDWMRRASFPPLLARAHAALAAALLASDNAVEAGREFAAAQKDGAGSIASLGLGASALAQGRLEEAQQKFTEAREGGSSDIVAAAEYGLAEIAFQKGALRDFKAPAVAALRASPSGPAAPRLLYVLTGIAVEEKDWPAALDHAKKLIQIAPNHETADDALERIGAGAAKVKAWPVVYEAYTLMRQRYPQSPFMADGAALLAEAQLQTNRAGEARRDLEALVAQSPRGSGVWVLLARAREATGDRQGALDAYARATSAGASPDVAREASLGSARVLMQEQRWDQARALLDGMLKSPDQVAALDAAYAIGETYRNEGDLLAATEYYMTAAYLAPESDAGRRSLLAAAQSFAALKQRDAAVTVYKKLLAQASLPANVGDAARQGLAALGR
jgi:tetratricopeptide (TPR) repeat protein